MSDILSCPENRVLVAARLVREHYLPNRKSFSPDWILIHALQDLLDLQPDASPQDLFRQLLTQSSPGSRSLMSRYVVASLTTTLDVALNEARDRANIFRGGQKFSFARISAMAAFFASRSKHVCPVKLNQVLFYSDFVHHATYGRSISGAKYVRRIDGPIIDNYASVLKTLFYAGVLKEKAGSAAGKEFIVHEEPSILEFSLLEILTLYWVHAEFGDWTGSEIEEYSQQESLYRFTRQDECIAYEYSRFLAKIPADPTPFDE